MEQLHILIHLTDSEKYAKSGLSLCREKMVLLPHKCLVGRAFFSFLGLKLFFRSLKHVVIRMGSSEIPCDVKIYQMVLCNMQSSVCRPKSAKEGLASLIWVETVHLNEHTCIVKSNVFHPWWNKEIYSRHHNWYPYWDRMSGDKIMSKEIKQAWLPLIKMVPNALYKAIWTLANFDFTYTTVQCTVQYSTHGTLYLKFYLGSRMAPQSVNVLQICCFLV